MQSSEKIKCPLCDEPVEKLLYRYHVDSEQQVIGKIKKENPGWCENDGICSRCVDYYQLQIVIEHRMLPEIGPHFPVKSADDFIILPTPLRVDAMQKYTGNGVTICFIDSGFYLHDDLIKTKNRVKKIIDVTDLSRTEDFFKQPHSSAWHGTMTTVVCAGDGYSSNGLYKGIASEAELVLLKVQDDENKITNDSIEKALQWVIAHHKEYNIKIVNMSLGGEEVISNQQSVIDQLAELLIREGIMVIAAVGNDEYAQIKPPATAKNVISVGGIDDNNFLDQEKFSYHSSYGLTVDGFYKPELTANAIWIAAPILPGSDEKKEAELLHRASSLDTDSLIDAWPAIEKKLPLEKQNGQNIDVTYIRNLLTHRIRQTKFFSESYMHVDGTSFAAPIVCSVIAQMLEVNPLLDPASIRRVLFSTAKRIPGIVPEKQGFGYIRPRHALIQIIKKEVVMKSHESPYLNKRKKTIEFYFENDCAHQISLAGTFNHWAQDVLLLEAGKNGVWKIEIPMLAQGTYKYKFFVDDKMWVEDVENPLREPDGFTGWNSLLIV